MSNYSQGVHYQRKLSAGDIGDNQTASEDESQAMAKHVRKATLPLLALWSAAALAAAPSQKAVPGKSTPPVATTRHLYKQKPPRALTLHLPDGWKASDRRSALVIFRCRIPVQREHFRKLGMVIVKPDLAPVNSGKLPGMTLEEIAAAPKPRQQVEDSKSVIRFLRKNATKLGIDPRRIAATGTSGGGDLALQTCINTAFESAEDDRTVSPRPDALVLYCPAFDGIDIWYVKTSVLVDRTRAESPAFLPLLSRFVKNTTDVYATPLDHRANLIERASKLGRRKEIDMDQVKKFQKVLELFNQRDWQLLHPVEDALTMSASRILTRKPLPPTLLMLGGRDHLAKPQQAFLVKAKSLGQKFQVVTYEQGGHSFMMQPAFLQPSTDEAERFLRGLKFLPSP